MTSKAQRGQGPTVVYTPDSPIRRPKQLATEMFRDLKAARFLAWRLFIRDISAQYRQTLFGYVWALVPALLTTLVWVVLNSTQFVSIHTGEIPYPIYALTGTIFWFLFIDALNAPLRQLSSNKAMLNRVNFPTEALILSGIAQTLFSFSVKLLFLGALLIAYSVSLAWTAVFVIIPAFALLVLGTVVGLLLSPLGLLYRDVENGLVAVVMPLMFVTPVVYPRPVGTVGRIVDLNPLTPAFTALRDVLYKGRVDALPGVGIVLAGALVFGAIAWVVYRVAMPVLVERMEA